MSKLKLIDLTGKISEVEFKENSLIEKKPNKQAIFDSIIAEDSGSRQGTHSTKTKAEVRGGGKKPWRQKHTGRARQGSIRAPQWVGGGRVFGPKPEKNYEIKINKKVRKLAFRSAFTIKLNDNSLYLLDAKANMKKPSTKSINTLLKTIKFDNKKVLFVLNETNENIEKSCSNMVNINAKKWNQVSTKDLLNYNIVIFQEDILTKLAEAFG